MRLLLLIVFPALAMPASIEWLPSRTFTAKVKPQLTNQLESLIPNKAYSRVAAQIITGEAAHVLIHLFSKKYHLLEFAKATIHNDQITRIEWNYKLTKLDKQSQPGLDAEEAKCPDETIEMISLCPNSDPIEIEITQQVTRAAKTHKLKTVELLQKEATRQSWLNYMSCPKLRGNFYDGDSNSEVIAVADGFVSAEDIGTVLKDKFRFEVTNVWVACHAYNDPMLSAVTKDAQARKYAAGINALEVGPSDRAALCAMRRFFGGKPMAESFQDCHENEDSPRNQWGFGGDGTNYF